MLTLSGSTPTHAVSSWDLPMPCPSPLSGQVSLREVPISSAQLARHHPQTRNQNNSGLRQGSAGLPMAGDAMPSAKARALLPLNQLVAGKLSPREIGPPTPVLVAAAAKALLYG